MLPSLLCFDLNAAHMPRRTCKVCASQPALFDLTAAYIPHFCLTFATLGTSSLSMASAMLCAYACFQRFGRHWAAAAGTILYDSQAGCTGMLLLRLVNTVLQIRFAFV